MFIQQKNRLREAEVQKGVGGHTGGMELQSLSPGPKCFVFFCTPILPTIPVWRPIEFSLESIDRMLEPTEGAMMVEISDTKANGDRILPGTDIFNPTW